MARNKLKKAPHQPQAPPSPIMDQDDDDLMNDLLAQLDSRNQTVQSESASLLNEMHLDSQADQIEASGRQDAKSRFKARQARKAAALAQTYASDDPATEARLEQEAKDEERDIERVCRDLLLQIHEINPDGHCLFSAIADQLDILGIVSSSDANYETTRRVASNYMFSHPDDFIPFLPSVGDGDAGGAPDSGLMTMAEFEQYCVSVRDTAVWGGEPEILALSRAYNVPIHVVQGGRPPIVVHSPGNAPTEGLDEKRVVRISYHRRMYGLGEHYNSLRPKGPLSQLSQRMQTMLS